MPDGSARRSSEADAGESIQRRIAPGETHEFVFVLAEGDFLEFRIDQLGVDLALTLFGPGLEEVFQMDLPTGDFGPEMVLWVAREEGPHLLVVKPWGTDHPGGDYRARLVNQRPAGATDRLRARAVLGFLDAQRLSGQRDFGQAVARFEDALEVARRAGDELWQAEILDRLGAALIRMGDRAEAANRLEEASALFAGLAEPRLAVVSANRLAMVYSKLGDMDRALQQLRQALELRRRLEDRRGEGMTLASMADIHKVRGETQEALDLFQQALDLLDRPEDRRYRAAPLHNLGTLYHRLGKREEALERLRVAQRIYAENEDRVGQAASLAQIGQLAFEAGEPERALRVLELSLQLRRQVGEPLGEAAALRKIGSVLQASGDVDEARGRYQQALELLAGSTSPRSEASLLADLGRLDSRVGRHDQALAWYQRSLAVFEEVGDPLGQAEALLGLARAERARGRPQAALQPAQQALEIAEALRIKAYSEDLRLSFFSSVQRYFDFNIELLMELDRAQPQRGHGAAALQVFERARARSLLDLLAEAEAEIRGDAPPELLAEERRLQRLVNRSVAAMEDDTTGEEERRRASRGVREGLRDLDRVRAAIRRNSPRYSELTQPRLLNLEEIQRQLLDEQTLLLAYRLGGERSFLWLVGRESLASFDLGSATTIEEAARDAHRLLAGSWRREVSGRTRALLCELSRLLLRPAGDELGRKRLIIVADGALEYLPFAALPDPVGLADCTTAEPLLVRHEITRLPSASTLAVLRREDDQRVAPVGEVAVVADPVYGVDDPRMGASRVPAVDPAPAPVGRLRGAQDVELGRYRRLEHSRAEAEAILGLVPSDQTYAALGFDASKQAILAGALNGYRLVHFSTHGIVDAEEPALSRVVLSLVDRSGRRVDGILPAHEVYNLRLPSELVVLAACETALGREVRGEGLVGLARGFMYAGASRVMVSLWKVSDRGTADLMKSFYRGVLREGLPPAAALRRAQLEIRARWPQPFYWAGFVVLGDWRGIEGLSRSEAGGSAG